MVLAKHKIKLDRELNKRLNAKVNKKKNLPIIFEMEEEFPSVKSD